VSTPFSEGGRAYTQNQHLLEDFKRKFATSTNFGQELLDLFGRAGAGVWRCESDKTAGQPRWWLNITLPANLQEMFDVHLEIQVLYAEYDRLEPRTLSMLQQRMSKDLRLEPGIAMVASNDTTIARMAQRRRGELSLVDIALKELAVDTRDLRSRISAVLTAVDHFDVTNPIQEPSAFFGRKAEIDQLTQALNRGQSVGIFGLRKAGKTSLMNSLQRLREDAGRPVVKIDLSEVSSADEFKLRLLERAWDAVFGQEGEDRAQSPRLRLRLLDSTGRTKSDVKNISLHWTEDLRQLIGRAQRRIELFIDEIDQAYPLRAQFGDETNALFQAIVQLRGLVQAGGQSDAGIVLLCAGVDPSIFEQALLEGRDNLIYKLVKLLWLSPMSRDEMAEMVRALGKRTAVRFRGHEVIDKLYQEFGGHPLLTRKACSAAIEGRDPAELPFYLSLDRLEHTLGKRGVSSVAEQARDVFKSFAEWFPEEAQILPLIWSTEAGDREVGRAFLDELPDGLAHAKSYGLVNDDETPRIRALLPAIRGLR
jgi:hypothetical protein